MIPRSCCFFANLGPERVWSPSYYPMGSTTKGRKKSGEQIRIAPVVLAGKNYIK